MTINEKDKKVLTDKYIDQRKKSLGMSDQKSEKNELSTFLKLLLSVGPIIGALIGAGVWIGYWFAS